MKTLTQKQHVQRDREAHHAGLLALAQSLGATNQTGLAIWRKLKRIENVAHGIATAYCNGEAKNYTLAGVSGVFNPNDEESWEAFSGLCAVAVSEVLGGVPPHFIVNGDARGYALKLASCEVGGSVATPFNLHRDWGNNQILAPTIE